MDELEAAESSIADGDFEAASPADGGFAHDHTPLPIRSILLYSSPLLAFNFIATLISTYYLKYGTDDLLLGASAIGAILGLFRLWEAVCDLLVGFLGDRSRHSMGRRRSWIAVSALPVLLFSIMMWAPPEGWGANWQLAWLVVGAFGLATALSTFGISHAALGAEISPLSQDRTRLFGANGVFGMLASATALTLGMYLLRTSETPRTSAIQVLGGAGVIFIALCVAMVSGTREPAHHLGRGATSPISALRDVFRNPHARVLIGAGLFVQITWAAMATVAVFMLEYVLHIEEATELFMMSYFIPTLLSVPIWVRLTRRFEKRHLWMVCLVGSAFAYLMMGIAPETATLARILPFAMLAGVSGAGFFIFEPAIRAEVIDFDEYETGERKEGVYSAASQVVGKLGAGLMPLTIGLVLEGAGYIPNMPQPEDAKFAIRVLFGGVPAAAFMTAFFLMMRFRLTEERHREIQRELEARVTRFTAAGAGDGTPE